MNRLPAVLSLEFAALMASGVASLGLHECAHAGVALATGGTVHRIGFNRRGFYNVRSRLATRTAELTCTLAGPAVHLALGLLVVSELRFVHSFGLLNLWLAGWNLIAPHSDGRRAWAELSRGGQ